MRYRPTLVQLKRKKAVSPASFISCTTKLYQLKSSFKNALRPSVKWLYAHGVTANQVTYSCCYCFGYSGWMVVSTLYSPALVFITAGVDVIADTALYLPFALLLGVETSLVLVIVFLAALSEFTGVLGLMVGASRRYDGPMGKSDRAFVFGLLAMLWAFNCMTPFWLNVVLLVMLLLLFVTIISRVRCGLAETATNIHK